MLKRVIKDSESAQMPQADAAYFRDAETWEQETYRKMRRSRTRAWLFALCCLALAGLSLLALILLLPLKTFEPYVVTVDRSTGYVEVTRGLMPGDLSQDEAITQSNLVRYITARESYDPPDLEENYNRVVLFSADQAQEEYKGLWSRTNKQNPSKVFGYDVEVRIKIKSINFLNDRTATVRFLRDRIEGNRTRTSHWNAVIAFRYVEQPASMLERFENPLGFQVVSYRVDQELLGETSE